MADTTTADAVQSKKRRIFYGWWIVLAGSTTNVYFIGVYSMGFTAFFNPLRETFHWSATAISLPLALRSLTGLLHPLIGSLIDRYGPRRLMIAGAMMAGAGSIWLSRVNSLPEFYGAVMLISLGSSPCTGVGTMVAVANWFNVKMGKATGIVQAALGLGGVLVPLLVWLIGAYSWRTAALVVGIGTFVICIPLSLVIRHKPEPYGYLPDGEVAQPQNQAAKAANVSQPAAEFSAREALRTRALWLLAIATALGVLPVLAIHIHIIPYLDQAVFAGDSSKAGIVVTAIAVLSVAGRWLAGWMANIWEQRNAFALMMLLEAIAMFIFAYARTVWMLIPFLVLYAPTQGANSTIRTMILRQYFGRKSFGAIMGVLYTALTVAGLVAPPLAGWLVDRLGSYTLAWVIFGIATFMGVPLALLLKPPTRRLKAQTEA